MSERIGIYAGWVNYNSKFSLSDDELEVVRDFLTGNQHIEGAENFEVICDWHWFDLTEKDRADTYIALCMDGGDWEEPVFFLLKKSSTNFKDDGDIFIIVPQDQKEINVLAGARHWTKDTSLLSPVLNFVDGVAFGSAWTNLRMEL